MNSYLAFLKKLFYAPFDEGMLRQGYERMIDEHLLNLRKIDNMKVSYIGLPHADEHLYQIIRLWFGLDGRPLSKKEIGLIEDLHGGRVVSVHLVDKKIRKAMRILRHPSRYLEFRDKIMREQ